MTASYIYFPLVGFCVVVDEMLLFLFPYGPIDVQLDLSEDLQLTISEYLPRQGSL